MTEMTILTVQLIVEFSKHLPGFQTLCRDDQVSPYIIISKWLIQILFLKIDSPVIIVIFSFDLLLGASSKGLFI